MKINWFLCKSLWILVGLFSLITNCYACVCSRSGLPMDTNLLKQYPVIALVKINSLETIGLPVGNQLMRTTKINIQVLEKFKGIFPDELYLDGVGSSCDIGLRAGDEWMLFPGQINGYLTVIPCGYSFKYKASNGLKDFKENEPDRYLNFIRQLVGKPSVVLRGWVKDFYTNKQLACRAYYKEGKLEGKRQVWYPDGTHWAEEHYKNGSKEGISSWWFADGLLESRDHFRAGMAVDTSWQWYPIERDSAEVKLKSRMTGISTDSLRRVLSRRQLYSLTIYGPIPGQSYRAGFAQDGTLLAESVYDPMQHLVQWIWYNHNRKFTRLEVRNSQTDQILYGLSQESDGSQKAYFYARDYRPILQTRIQSGRETIETLELNPN